VLQRAAQATQGLFDQKPAVRLVVDAPGDVPDLVGDRDRLTQVAINLISNAVKFTPAGEVRMTLAREVDPEVGDALVVRVRDTGVGIAPEDHATVFEQFRQVGDTLTEKPQGTGLGLPICKQIVEHHAGRMWLESAVGAGSTFAFALPLTPPEEVVEAAAAPVPAPDPGPSEGVRRFVGSTVQAAEAALRRRVEALVRRTLSGAEGEGAPTTCVLVVDDDPQIRSLLRQELEEVGHAVVEAADGREALAAVAARRPDLIVLDVMMPELTGFDVAAVLRGDPATASVPIVILSVVQDEERGARLGVARYFTKPVDVRALVQEVAVVLRDAATETRIVLVDPPGADPEDRRHAERVRAALRDAGYAVEEVASAAEALARRGTAHPPDLILAAADVARGTELEGAAHATGVDVVLFQ
jgi:CheY-like chemotaxis protein